MRRSNLFNHAVLSLGLFGLSAVLVEAHEEIRKPLRADDIAVYSDGTASTGIFDSTTYDFNKATVNFVSGVNVTPNYMPVSQLSDEQKQQYKTVQREACKIAQGHEGYDQVCIGLKIN